MSDGRFLVAIDLEKAAALSKDEIRKFISDLEAYMKTAPQVELPLTHFFSERVYGRELGIAKGSLLVGKIHKFRTMNVITKGEVSVISIEGVKRVKAGEPGATFVSCPGTKRVIYAHEDAIWTTFHGTTETDLGKIENEIIAKDYDDVVELTSGSLELKEAK